MFRKVAYIIAIVFTISVLMTSIAFARGGSCNSSTGCPNETITSCPTNEGSTQCACGTEKEEPTKTSKKKK